MLDEITRIRTEVKFAVDDREAGAIAAELAEHLDPVRECWITSTYLDRPDRGLSAAVRSSPTVNIKIRLRDYGHSDALWLELKRRAGAASEKVRVRLARRALDRFLAGGDVSAELDSVEGYREIRGYLPGPARPVGSVRFFRRSLESVEPRVRVTLDRDITYHRAGDLDHSLGREELGTLEIKYGTLQPLWLPAITRRLTPSTPSKFLGLLRHVDRL
jgi:hypothetical protein